MVKKICELFYENGFDVFGWDCYQRNDNYIKFNIVDMLKYTEIINDFKKISPNIVIHCAGLVDVGKSVKNSEKDYEYNVTITHNLLFAIHKLKLSNIRIVFLSSTGVYGNPIMLPITEDMPLNPLSPYALHKVMCEEICYYFVKNYGMDIKVARIFSAYGAGLKKQLFWSIYNKVKTSGRLDMFGTGNESRDYIHVKDVVESLYLLETAEPDEIIFNVANGKETTIRQTAECFAEYVGIEKEQISFNNIIREGDPLNWRADISRIQKIGYRKSVDIKEGLAGYCQWAKMKDDNEVVYTYKNNIFY